MLFYNYLKKHWLTIIVTLFAITLYLIFHFFLILFINREILIILFIIILLFILFPLKEYLISQQFIIPNWDYLIHSEFHHFEFLARYFSLKDLIQQITPELMIWLKIPVARLFILNPDKKTYTMYLYDKGKIESIHVIPKRRIFYLTKMLRKYHHIITRESLELTNDERSILEKFGVYIVVPFYHLNRLMGFITFHFPTENKFVNRALELYAIKSALLIHDEILKRRIQNIAKYEEEIKIAEKIRQMLQSNNPPDIPNIKIHLKPIQSATLIEFYQHKNKHYIIILSIPRINGVSAMILSGELGYLFAYLQYHKTDFNIRDLLNFLNTKKDLHHEDYPVEHMIIEIEDNQNYFQTYILNNQQYYLKKYNNKFYRIPHNGRIYFENNEILELYYRDYFLFSIEYMEH
ncbi:MAG: hypothetical protein KatS3mg129_1356 [Leptospiraceae bacterium]|nr:MAG: hypothetical protein KatS3mg129_1356 [Leptospiraceae bacterium]